MDHACSVDHHVGVVRPKEVQRGMRRHGFQREAFPELSWSRGIARERRNPNILFRTRRQQHVAGRRRVADRFSAVLTCAHQGHRANSRQAALHATLAAAGFRDMVTMLMPLWTSAPMTLIDRRMNLSLWSSHSSPERTLKYSTSNPERSRIRRADFRLNPMIWYGLRNGDR